MNAGAKYDSPAYLVAAAYVSSVASAREFSCIRMRLASRIDPIHVLVITKITNLMHGRALGGICVVHNLTVLVCYNAVTALTERF